MKIIGLIVLILGIAIITATLFFSFLIFTARMETPSYFSATNDNSIELIQNGENEDPIIADQILAILPENTISKLLNLSVWMMLAFILIFGGSRISGIGIKMMQS